MSASGRECAGGCGRLLASPRSQRCKACANRDPSKLAAIATTRHAGSGGEYRTCPICGREKWVAQHKLEYWKACSRAHFAELRRQHGAWNALQERCLAWMSSNDVSRSELARRVGVGGWILESWFAKEGSSLRRDALEALAAVLGITAGQALVEAGGKTAEDVWRETGRRNGRVSHSGFKRSADEIQRMVATKRAKGLFDSDAFKLVKISRSLRMQVIKSLSGYLIHHRQASPKELRTFAVRVAGQHGWSVSSVTALWRPYLQRRGLSVQAGRPALATNVKTARAAAIAEVRASWPRTKHGDLADGFWSAALDRVKQAEGPKAPSSKESLRQWWLDQGELSA